MALRLLLWKADDTLHLVLLGNQVMSMHRTTCWLSLWWLSVGHARLCDPMDSACQGFLVLNHLPEFAQTHVHWVHGAMLSSHPLSSPPPPALNLSNIKVFSNELALAIGWLKYWSFNVSISPSSENSGLISFRFDWDGSIISFTKAQTIAGIVPCICCLISNTLHE